jgi:hypothetical protein
MERAVRARAVRIKHGRTWAFRKFWRRHPYLYSIAATIAVFAVITLAVALIQSAANGFSGGNNPPPPVAVPPVPAPPSLNASTQSETDPPAPSIPPSAPGTTASAPIITAPDPATAVPEPLSSPTAESTSEDPTPYSAGQCLAGNFDSSTPTDVQQVSCSSEGAYEILASYPGDSENVCEDVEGAELAYIQEELLDGAVVWSYVDCLGQPVG